MHQVTLCMSFHKKNSILHTHMFHVLTMEMATTSKAQFDQHWLHGYVGSPLDKVCSISRVTCKQHKNDTKWASNTKEDLPCNVYTNHAIFLIFFPPLCDLAFNLSMPCGSNSYLYFVLCM